ncbi:hypothetical protein [Ideonella sp.]|uniref:hypothetical protein n=1 Tax=Ideonella sp. TaxID=1929293 RepID=UPI0035B41D59
MDPLRIGSSNQSTSVHALTGGAGLVASTTPQAPQTGPGSGVLPGPARGPANTARPRTAVLPQPPGWQPTAVVAATTALAPATVAAVQTAQAAQVRLPELVDQHAQDSAIAKAAHDTTTTLQSQWGRIDQAAAQALQGRHTAVADARTELQAAQGAHGDATDEHTRLGGLLHQAQQDRAARSLELRQAEQAAAGRPQAPAGSTPSPAASTSSPTASGPDPQALRQALTQLDTTIGQHQRDLRLAAGRLASALQRLDGATAALTTAEQAVARLQATRTQAQTAFDTHLPAVQAHERATAAVLPAADAARRQHATLADLSLSVAHRTRVAQDAAQQEQAVGQLQAQRDTAAARLGAGGDLRLDRDQALASVSHHQAELGRANTEGTRLTGEIQQQREQIGALKARAGLMRALGRGRDHPVRQDRREAVLELRATRQAMAGNERQLAQTRQDAAHARRSLDGARHELAQADAAITRHQQTLAGLDAGLAAQQQRQQALRHELTQLQAWPRTDGAARDGQQALAQGAVDQAGQARQAAVDTAAPAQAAAQHIETALTALLAEVEPPPAAPAAADAQRTLLQRAADGVRGAHQGYVNRTGPAKVEITLAGVTHSSANTGPTTFNGGHAPGRGVTDAALGKRAQKAIDGKTATAGSAAAAQLAGQPGMRLFGGAQGPAATPEAMRSAVAFTREVGQLFQAPAAEAATLVGLAPTVLANRLLEHPNPDPVGRPDGHPLRHEEALLVASALSAVTSDPALAANVYNQLWNDRPPLPGVVGRDQAVPSPLASVATEPRGNAVSLDPQTVALAHAARRVLAGSPAGMQALMNLQGLALPPAGDPARGQAERVVEHYKLALRAETTLLGKLNVGGAQTTPDVLAAIDHAAPARQLLDAGILGTGRARREDPATLASQALKYAAANMSRADGAAEAHPEFKAAYVALRNGFTESGQGSDFNAMTRRLHKFVKYIDLAAAEQPSMATALGRFGRLAQRVAGKEMSPLTTLLQAGPLGSDLGQVPAEYKKQLGQAVTDSAALLANHLRHGMAGAPAADRERGLVRLAALQLWNEQLAATADPYVKVSLAPADVAQRAGQLAGTMPGPAALNPDVVRRECATHLGAPLTPKLLDTFLGKHAAGPVPAADPALGQLRESFAMLQGKGSFVSGLADLQREFDRGDPAQRRDVLRRLLISVVAGGDVADYSDGRKNAISGRVGFSPAGVSVNHHTVGITPVVEGSYDRTKATVLRAGVASNTGVLYLGKETRHAASLGVGVRAGLTEGLGDYSIGAIARLGGTHASSTGLMIRTNKQGSEHQRLPPDDEARMQSANWKRMTEMVVNTVFDLAGSGAQKPANAHDMWQGVVGALGDYHDISFGYNRGSATSANWSLQADGIAGIKLGPDDKKTLLSTQIGAGVKHTFFNRGKARDSAGALQAFQGTSASRVTGSASADAGVTHPVIKTRDGGSVMLLSRSKIGVESEMIFGASNGLVRLTTEDGRINPAVSFKHREVSVEGDFFKLVNAQRDQWRPRLGERGADGRLHNGDAALDTFMQQLANLPPGKNRTFIERKNLRTEAAETINAFVARLDVLQQGMHEHAARGAQPPPSMGQEIQALKERIASEVNDEANWQPFRLFVNETNQMSADSSLAGEARYAPAPRSDPLSQPDSASEAIRYGGGKFVIGGVVRVAHGGRDLLTLDAQPEHA